MPEVVPTPTQADTVSFTLNGRAVSTPVEEGETLLDVLRERFGITSPKNGCQPQASCGSCTVLVNGKALLSCVMPAARVNGKDVVTNEGLPDDVRQQVSDCFVRAGAVQCGFCIPGIVSRTVALVENNPAPTRDQITHELRAHLCRCTGYTKIIDAVEMYAGVRRGEALPAADSSGKIGTRLDRYTGQATALGDRDFVDDMHADGMLFGAPRLADHPRAVVRRIDASAAERIDGVVRVMTAADVPGQRYVGLIEQDWPIFVAVGEETRYVGDVIAVVVARSGRAARRAADAIDVEYEVLDPVADPHAALAPGAPKVHPAGNLLSHSRITRGDSEKALADSAHVVEQTFRTQRVEHLYLEPESCLAVPDGDGGLQVYSQGQGVFDDRQQIADVLALDPERIKVDLVANGGAFGGKEDMSIQAQTALAAVLCDAPVKITLTREQSFRVHPKRHPIEMRYRVGCDGDGRLTALRARMIGDTGAYASVGAKVLERAAGHAAGPYRLPNLDIEALAVYTNNPPCGAMRGFGVNQVAFAIESCLDMLAEMVGIDGWEMRWRNVLEIGDRCTTGQRMVKPFGLKKTLLAVKDAYRSARYAGIACGIKNVGIGHGMDDSGKAALTVEPGGRVTVRTGFTEMGQGLFTVCLQTAVQETGLSPDVFCVTTDTGEELGSGQTTGSRGTVLATAAVIDAARKLRADLDAGKTLDDLVGRVYHGVWACTDTHRLGADVPEPKTHLTYGFATQVAILDDDGRVAKVIAAHDVGKAINPTLLEGQIEGSIHMGLGYALTEELPTEGGRLVHKDIKSCSALRAAHMPEVEVILIEEPDPECAYGARGVGEIGLVPTAPAVAAALYAFDGIRRSTLPMKDSPAAKAILTRKPRR
ncbi:MAG TPA: selenium-dependent xanthine dehydrogenase [Phycisphaerae bacterium]|nr:selenium-dependent xanthine dehydrogenase [Phycisphaerae bacterium]